MDPQMEENIDENKMTNSQLNNRMGAVSGEVLETGATHSRTVELRTVEDVMEYSYLRYSMSVIVARALPDVRDGMKPVHRRILYSMEKNGWRPGSKFVKSARITGDVMGKYHPHGDVAIYDAMVRLAQPWSTRYLCLQARRVQLWPFWPRYNAEQPADLRP